MSERPLSDEAAGPAQPEMSYQEQKLRERVDGAYPVMDDLIYQLAEPIKRGEWSSLLIEGGSGRIPGLVVGGIMRRYATEHGQPMPPVNFLATGRDSWDSPQSVQETRKYIQHIRPSLGSRALLFTDYIQSGWSITQLAKELARAGIAFDIAAVESDDSAGESLQRWKEALPDTFAGARLFVGNALMVGARAASAETTHPTFYDARMPELRASSGAVRETGNPIAQRIPPPQFDSVLVGAARQEINTLQDKLYASFF